MTIKEEDKPQLRTYLMNQIRNGNGWVSYATSAEKIAERNLFSHATALEAEFHFSMANHKTHRMMPADVMLRSLDPGFSRGTDPIWTPKLIDIVLDCFPEVKFLRSNNTDLYDAVSKGEVFPVKVEVKHEKPVDKIESYELIRSCYPSDHFNQFHPSFVSEASFPDMQAGINKMFDVAVSDYTYVMRSENEGTRKDDLLLVGRLRGKSLLFNIEGKPVNNTGLLIASYEPARRYSEYPQENEIKIIHPPDRSVNTSETIYARIVPEGKFGLPIMRFYGDNAKEVDLEKDFGMRLGKASVLDQGSIGQEKHVALGQDGRKRTI